MPFKLATSLRIDCRNKNLWCNVLLILRCFITVCGESEIYCFSIAVSEKKVLPPFSECKLPSNLKLETGCFPASRIPYALTEINLYRRRNV
jgi:hypothetical protein